MTDSAAERYVFWAAREGKLRTFKTEQSYLKVLKELESFLGAPLVQVSKDALLRYQHKHRHMEAASWGVRCSVISEFCRYLVSQEGQKDDPSFVLKRRKPKPAVRMDPTDVELFMSTLAARYRAVADLIRETGLGLQELKGVQVSPKNIPTKLHVRGVRGEDKEVTLTPLAREALSQIRGCLPYSPRAYQRAFEAVGITAKNIERLGPSRALSLDTLHPRIGLEVRKAILSGGSGTDTPALLALREVEIRVREMMGASESQLGVSLMKEAFKVGGALARASDPGEQTAMMALFWGAIGTFKNPSSHRRVQFKDDIFAREVVLLADLLHRVLDDIESTTP